MVCVSLSICLFVKRHLTSGASVHPENAVKYSAAREICGVSSIAEIEHCLSWMAIDMVGHGGHACTL